MPGALNPEENAGRLHARVLVRHDPAAYARGDANGNETAAGQPAIWLLSITSLLIYDGKSASALYS